MAPVASETCKPQVCSFTDAARRLEEHCKLPAAGGCTFGDAAESLEERVAWLEDRLATVIKVLQQKGTLAAGPVVTNPGEGP